MINVPPNNPEIEKSLVGTMVTYPEEDYSQVEHDDFYDGELAQIADAVSSMKKEWIDVDMVTLYDYLKPKWVSIRTITELWTWIFSVASISSYIRTLKEYKRKRVAIRLWNEIAQLSDWDPSRMIDFAAKLQVASTIGMEWESSISYDDVTSAYEQIISRFWKKLYGYSWWDDFGFLDEVTKWIVKKRVYRIWAPSNTGKTQFVYNIIPSLLAQTNEDWTPVKVAFFTLENTKEDTLVSLMCNHSWLDASKVNSWELDGNWDWLTSLKDRLYIIDDVYDLDKIFSKIISIRPDIVILDYITHVTVAKSSWYEKYDTYAETVPKFAKSQDLAWIDLSNLPKNLQINDEIRAAPWFFGSSILMNNCDVAFHLMKNAQFKATKETVLKTMGSKMEDKVYFYTRACLDLLVTKNRWGSVFVEKTYWLNFASWWKWRELSEEDLLKLWAKYG